MADSRVDMRVDGARDLRAAAQALRDAGRDDLRRDLLKRLRGAGKPAVADVKRAVIAAPVKGVWGRGNDARGGRGLRATIARSTRVQVATGAANPMIRIRVVAARFKTSANPATLPKYFDGELSRFSRWRHPVWGNRHVWVEQKSHRFFFVTIRKHRDDFRHGVQQAIDDTLRKLGG